jgi:ribosomal protein S18 acetylase RimI-like enzyme
MFVIRNKEYGYKRNGRHRNTEVSTASISDIQTIAEIAFPKTYAPILSQEQINYMMDWMYSTDSLMKQMQDEGNTFFVARTKTKKVGFISIRPDGKDLYHIEKIYVLPNFQKNILAHIYLRKQQTLLNNVTTINLYEYNLM